MAHVEKRGPGRWRARYRAPDGNERSRTFSRRVDAERWLAEMEVAKGRGDWIDPRLGRTTFAEWTEEWQRTIVDLRDSTLSRDLGMVRNHLLPHFGRTPLAAITTTDVRSFVAKLQASGQHSPATVRKIGQVLNKIMASAVEGGLIGRSPCTGVRLPVEERRDMRLPHAGAGRRAGGNDRTGVPNACLHRDVRRTSMGRAGRAEARAGRPAAQDHQRHRTAPRGRGAHQLGTAKDGRRPPRRKHSHDARRHVGEAAAH